MRCAGWVALGREKELRIRPRWFVGHDVVSRKIGMKDPVPDLFHLIFYLYFSFHFLLRLLFYMQKYKMTS